MPVPALRFAVPLLTVAVAAALGSAPTASAHAGGSAHEARATRLVTRQAVANVFPPSIGARAFLSDAASGEPLAGKKVYFWTPDGTEICRAVTDGEGEAACNGPIRLGPTTVGTLTNGYVATFQGDKRYKGAQAFGTVNVMLRP
ncbi:hypothetical protein [Streptomyces griseocarneus]|uniref:hypothetical protein n=1 Tax=Streptomyces griseocarneus TaxID=51201 RepID=UPI00167CD42A|nr:hypothetical protein [Streptomyces griseocarneus]MBZ6473571.1 hypothetical protein [Streptomyces griseocarneus]GHG56267.1 hypothetical protein GCM10018779_20170 [Streptomyces griseocarneus]